MKFSQITKNIYSNYSLNDIRSRMKLLGKDNDKDVLKFLNIRLLTSIIIFCVGFIDFLKSVFPTS